MNPTPDLFDCFRKNLPLMFLLLVHDYVFRFSKIHHNSLPWCLRCQVDNLPKVGYPTMDSAWSIETSSLASIGRFLGFVNNGIVIEINPSGIPVWSTIGEPNHRAFSGNWFAISLFGNAPNSSCRCFSEDTPWLYRSGIPRRICTGVFLKRMNPLHLPFRHDVFEYWHKYFYF